jgi:hypothetical protein
MVANGWRWEFQNTRMDVDFTGSPETQADDSESGKPVSTCGGLPQAGHEQRCRGRAGKAEEREQAADSVENDVLELRQCVRKYREESVCGESSLVVRLF